MEQALKEKASAVILVHNHPSGDPTPSKEDIDFTRESMLAAQVVGIELHDHIIIAKGKCYSLKAAGYL
ncbi:MAG: hypothetical protein IKO35_06660 [Elusimicrobiaceae bacterium]|nr:hypothetical protein [Elusimicrobiaceae bacterium]